MHSGAFSAAIGATFALMAVIANWAGMPNVFAVSATLALWSFAAAIVFAIINIF
jgi:hypothetical protein